MIDISGNFTYSRIVTAMVQASGLFVIEVYPNPGKGRIAVIIHGMTDNKGTISVTDITGKQMKQVRARNTRTDIDIAELAAGIYFLRYFDGNHSQAIKIVKQ